MTPQPIVRGANVALSREVAGLETVVVGVDCETKDDALRSSLTFAALLCDADRRAPDAQHFVFFNQMVSADLSTEVREQTFGNDDEQIEVDLNVVPPHIESIEFVLYVNDSGGVRRTLKQLRSCRMRLLNAQGNGEIVRTEDLAPYFQTETASVLGRLYRYKGEWRFRVTGQGYAEGLTKLAQDYGVPL
ncbi:TerD family protein [Micrococcales bacterium 31B]|nr:TerD family protein [Micrococcales bacterium 31B]